MPQNDAIEGFAGQSCEVAVAQRADGRAAAVAGDEAHLADRLACRNAGEQTLGVAAIRAEAAGDHDIQGV